LMTAPPEFKDQAIFFGGKVCLVPGTSFAETSEEALAELKPLDDCRVMAKSLGILHRTGAPSSFA
jgi:hypothetical protein